MKRLNFFILFILITIPIWSQSATSILDNVASRLKNNSIELAFSATTFNGNKESGTIIGKLQCKGQQFKVSTNTFTTWFNGKDQWTLLSGSDEVNLTTPTKDDLQKINPYNFINIYQKGYRISKRDVAYCKKKCIELTLHSTTNNNYERILLIIDQAYNLVNVRTKDRQGNWLRFRINSIQLGKKISNHIFSFNKNEYPNIEIIDLR